MPASPDPLVIGINFVNATGLYVNAADHGSGSQNVTIELWEDDPVFNDKLAKRTVFVSRPANAIKDTAVSFGGIVTFTITNTAGTISGNEGSSEDTPAKLYYKYNPGSGSQDSPVNEVDVTQP